MIRLEDLRGADKFGSLAMFVFRLIRAGVDQKEREDKQQQEKSGKARKKKLRPQMERLLKTGTGARNLLPADAGACSLLPTGRRVRSEAGRALWWDWSHQTITEKTCGLNEERY